MHGWMNAWMDAWVDGAKAVTEIKQIHRWRKGGHVYGLL